MTVPVYLVCRVEDRATAAAEVAQVSGRVEDDTADFFGVALENGAGVITHYLASLPIPEAEVATLPARAAGYTDAHWSQAEGVDLVAWLATLGLCRHKPTLELDTLEG